MTTDSSAPRRRSSRIEKKSSTTSSPAKKTRGGPTRGSQPNGRVKKDGKPKNSKQNGSKQIDSKQDSKPSYSKAPFDLELDILLFDMDGTIVDSTPAIVKHWHRLGAQLGVDPEVILKTSHGRRSIDTLELYDPKLANWEYVKEIEGRIPYKYGKDAVEVPGSRALLESLDTAGVPWMIVTSGTRPLIDGWLDVMHMAHPTDMVVAEDVAKGKPDPTCYQLGAQKLGAGPGAAVLVLEDSPAGVRAGKAAGYTVVALETTHKIEQLQEAGADYIVQDVASVTLKSWDAAGKKVVIQVAGALE